MQRVQSRAALARDLVLAADIESADLTDLRADTRDRVRLELIDARKFELLRWRDAVEADLDSADPRSPWIDADMANLQRALRDATALHPPPMR